MIARDFEWEVRRDGGTVRVDVIRASDISEADLDEVGAATEALLVEDGVSTLQLDGPMLESPLPPKSLPKLVLAMDQLAQRCGKRLVVTPI